MQKSLIAFLTMNKVVLITGGARGIEVQSH